MKIEGETNQLKEDLEKDIANLTNVDVKYVHVVVSPSRRRALALFNVEVFIEIPEIDVNNETGLTQQDQIEQIVLDQNFETDLEVQLNENDDIDVEIEDVTNVDNSTLDRSCTFSN